MTQQTTTPNRRRSPRGQSLTEFTVMLSMMLSIVFVSVLLIAVFSEYGYRVLKLIGLEFP